LFLPFFDLNRVSFPCDKNDLNTSTRRACAPPFNQNQFGFTLGETLLFVPKPGGERRTFFSPPMKASGRCVETPRRRSQTGMRLRPFGQFWVMRDGSGGTCGTPSNEESVTTELKMTLRTGSLGRHF
jgi:hypothetical protein